MESFSWSLSITSPSGPIPLLQLPTLLNQRPCWATLAWSLPFPIFFLPAPTPHLCSFSRMGKVSSSNSLVATDPIFQIKNWNMLVWCENI